jgi:hypothetical protein
MFCALHRARKPRRIKQNVVWSSLFCSRSCFWIGCTAGRSDFYRGAKTSLLRNIMMSLKLIRSPLSLVLAGCLATAFSAQADIVIGVAGPFTGPNATYGDQYWHGATQAAEDINAAGGINGEKIKLVQGMMPASLNKPSRSPTVWSTRKKSTRLSAISAPHPPCPPLRCIAMRALLPSPRLNQPTDHRTWHERYVPHVWPR